MTPTQTSLTLKNKFGFPTTARPNGSRGKVLKRSRRTSFVGESGRPSIEDDQEPVRLEVHEFLGVREVSSTEGLFAQLIGVSDRIYQECGVNVLLPDYGQIGLYEAGYKAYERGGSSTGSIHSPD